MSTVRRHPAIGLTAVTLYAAAIVAANYLTTHYGLVPVGFGLTATAGIYCAGLALMLRNVVQDHLGRVAVVGAIVAGATLSAISSPALALASGVAFGVSEVVDTLVYTPLRRRGWARAVLPASFVGALIDTFLFLDLAGFPVTTTGALGQLVGKTWAVWVPVLLFAAARRAHREVSGDPVIP